MVRKRKKKFVGRTEERTNDSNPQWASVFKLSHKGDGRRLRVDVFVFDESRVIKKSSSSHDAYDPAITMYFQQNAKLQGHEHELLDYLEDIDLSDLLSNGVEGKFEMEYGGTLNILCEAINGNGSQGTMLLQIRGLRLKNVEGGLLQGLSDPFYEIYRRVPCKSDYTRSSKTSSGKGISWMLVYRSEHIFDHVNPVWEPFVIDLGLLCNGELDNDIWIKVFDWEKSSKHRPIGTYTTTPNELIQKKCNRGNGDLSKALAMMQDGKSRGSLIVLQAKVKDGKKTVKFGR